MHADCGWSEGVFGGKGESSPVLAVVIGSVWWAGEDVVPFEDVGLGGAGGDELGRRLLEVLVFTCETFVGGFGGHFLSPLSSSFLLCGCWLLIVD